MASLWASSDHRRRLAKAKSALFLIGGYDGSGNYGDVLQLATALETANRLHGPLVVVVVEREMLAHHSELARRYGQWLSGAAFAFFEDGEESAADGLEELPPDIGPAESALYIYGGGHLNGWWGARKAAHSAAAERLAGGPPLPVVTSGLQVDEAAVESGGPAHELLTRASWIGVRDRHSLELVRRHVPGGTGRLNLAGDDAVPFLRAQPVPDAVVNLHLNDGVWVSDEPEVTQEKIVALLCELGKAAGEPLALQPVIAYEDPRVSERTLVSTLLEQQGDRLEEAGLVPVEPVDILEDAIGNGLARFARARLTVSCSYHATLTSLLVGIPAVLLAENDYYEQKAAGLRDLFQLDARLVGVRGTETDASAASEALVDGPARTALLAHLQEHSQQVGERFVRGRAALSVVIIETLRLRHDEIQTMQTPLRSRVRRLLRRPSLLPPAPAAIPADLLKQISSVENLAKDAAARSDHALAVARDMSLPTKMLAFMSWLELHPSASGPLVSVVLATRDRPEPLARAIASVVAQRYEEWELIIVDDGTDPGTPAVVEALEDERLRVIEGPRRGLSAARNTGLAQAKGKVICYLDDDNVMHPSWLHAVAHFFSERNDVDVAYGITLSEHRLPDDLGEYGWWPSFWQLPWSRETLERENVADAGALAHRRELEEARFDEELSTGEDWDLLLRLTADRDALAIPAVSHAYTMHGDDRMSADPKHRAGLAEIRQRHRANKPQ